MSVDERRRIELFERLVPLLGEEAATTMFELLPPPGVDAATKDDIVALRQSTSDDIAALRVATQHDIAELRRDMVTKQDLRESLSHELSHYATKADLHREFVTFFLGQTVALAGVLAGAAAFFGD